MTVHPSELQFDRALLDAVEPAFEEHLQQCEPCTKKLLELRAAQAAFAASPEPMRAGRIIQGKLEARRWSSRLRALLFVPALAAAALALLVVLPRQSGNDDIRLKGEPALELYRKTASGVERLPMGAALAAGDQVQLGYQAAGRKWLTVFVLEKGCEARKELTAAADGNAMLPVSWKVDATGGRAYVAFGSNEVSETSFEAALRAAPSGCESNVAPTLQADGFIAKGVVLAGGTK